MSRRIKTNLPARTNVRQRKLKVTRSDRGTPTVEFLEADSLDFFLDLADGIHVGLELIDVMTDGSESDPYSVSFDVSEEMTEVEISAPDGVTAIEEPANEGNGVSPSESEEEANPLRDSYESQASYESPSTSSVSDDGGSSSSAGDSGSSDD
jgi:hypothetical protein